VDVQTYLDSRVRLPIKATDVILPIDFAGPAVLIPVKVTHQQLLIVAPDPSKIKVHSLMKTQSTSNVPADAI